jgi:hypothetical protein
MKELLVASYEGDATLLFGDEFTRSRKHVTKIEEERKTTHAPSTRGHSSGYHGEKGGGMGSSAGLLFGCILSASWYSTRQRAKHPRGSVRGGRRPGGRGAKRFWKVSAGRSVPRCGSRCGTLIYDCDSYTVGEGGRPPEGVRQSMGVHPIQGYG